MEIPGLSVKVILRVRVTLEVLVIPEMLQEELLCAGPMNMGQLL